MEQNNSLAIFQGKEIRKDWLNNEWYFSVVDIIWALTDSADPKDYWYRLKKGNWILAGLNYRQFVDS